STPSSTIISANVRNRRRSSPSWRRCRRAAPDNEAPVPVLALDVGERRIGVAVSDPGESFALPLRVVERTSLREDLAAIVALAAEHGSKTIVVGDPLRLSGERGIAAEKIDRFCAALAREYD